MAQPAVNNAATLIDLPFRPQQGLKRRRSPSSERDVEPPAQVVARHTIDMPIRWKPHAVDDGDSNHPAKRQRGDDGAVPTTSAAMPTSKNVLAKDSKSSTGNVPRRVLRKKAPVSPFVPQKTAKVLVRRSARQNPVFGQATLQTVDPAGMALVVALKKPEFKVDKQPIGLSSQVRDSNGPLPNTAGFERGEINDFVKEEWSRGDYQDEKSRRANIFIAHPQHAWLTFECDNCEENITGTRYRCKHCDNFDFCQDCYTDPKTSYKHQHAAK